MKTNDERYSVLFIDLLSSKQKMKTNEKDLYFKLINYFHKILEIAFKVNECDYFGFIGDEGYAYFDTHHHLWGALQALQTALTIKKLWNAGKYKSYPIGIGINIGILKVTRDYNDIESIEGKGVYLAKHLANLSLTKGKSEKLFLSDEFYQFLKLDKIDEAFSFDQINLKVENQKVKKYFAYELKNVLPRNIQKFIFFLNHKINEKMIAKVHDLETYTYYY